MGSREGSGKQQFEEKENIQFAKMDLDDNSASKAEMKAKQIENPPFENLDRSGDHVIPESRMASPRAMQTIEMEAETIGNEMKAVLDNK